MELFFTNIVGCLCLFIYFPIIARNMHYIRQREVVLTRWTLFNIRVTHFTGASALVFAGANMLGGLIGIATVFTGIFNADLLIIIIGGVTAVALSQSGRVIAASMQEGTAEYDAFDYDKMQQPRAGEKQGDDDIFYITNDPDAAKHVPGNRRVVVIDDEGMRVVERDDAEPNESDSADDDSNDNDEDRRTPDA